MGTVAMALSVCKITSSCHEGEKSAFLSAATLPLPDDIGHMIAHCPPFTHLQRKADHEKIDNG